MDFLHYSTTFIENVVKKQSSRKGIKCEFSDLLRYKTEKPVLHALCFHPKGHFSIGRKFCNFLKRKRLNYKHCLNEFI